MKRRGAAMLAALVALPLLSGCAAALIPAGMAAAYGVTKLPNHPLPSKQAKASAAARATTRATLPDIAVLEAAGLPSGITVLPMTELPRPDGASSSAAFDRRALRHSYDALTRYLFGKAADYGAGRPVKSVVLMPNVTADAPSYTVCETMPLAMVIDVDSANATGAVPAALVEAVTVARMADIEPMFVTDRPAADASAIEAALTAGGLGPVTRGNNLWLANGMGKDSQRWKIASRRCVVAMVGDEPGDFSQIYDATIPQTRTAADALWGEGWFVLPSPAATTNQQNARVTQ